MPHDMLDDQIIGYVSRHPAALTRLQAAGVVETDFVDEWPKVWRYLCRTHKNQGIVPSPDVIEGRFNVALGTARQRDVPVLLGDLQKRRTHREFIDALVEASEQCS